MSVYAEVLGREPGQVVRPGSQEEARDVVAQASADGKTVVPWGGGTGQTFGYLPKSADVLLDLSGLNRVVAVEPGDLTITVEAGVTLDAVQEALAMHGQFLPLDPAHPAQATMGGIVATNAWGASRLGFGTVRDWLIGIAVVDGEGRRVKGGGKVVKNVTGYDLPKLHVGALGTLGVVVEATFKTAPLPESSRGFLLGGGDLDGNAQTVLARLHEETTPTISVLREVRGGIRALALVYTGFVEVVEEEMARALDIARAHGADVVTLSDTMPAPFGPPPPDAPLVVRVSGSRADAASRHRELAGDEWQLADTLPGTGHTTLHLAPDSDPQTALAKMVQWSRERQIPFSVWHAPLAVREAGPDTSPLWFPLPSTLPLTRRMKAALDPGGLLNPGRFVGGL